MIFEYKSWFTFGEAFFSALTSTFSTLAFDVDFVVPLDGVLVVGLAVLAPFLADFG